MPHVKFKRICTHCSKAFFGGRNKTCSPECAKARLSHGGRVAVDIIRPIAEKHYLWKGGAENRARWKAEYKLRYPERVRARQMIDTAVRRGKLVRQPCSVCGAVKSEAHHEDYNKPMDVIWLCRPHHREADKRLGIGAKDFG